MAQNAAANIDEYVATVPPQARETLERVRALIHETLPGAVESISYAIPTIHLNGRRVIAFAGYAHHIGMYPAPIGVPGFEDLAQYASGKATARFPLGEPLPEDLIRRIVRYQVERAASR